MTGFQIWEELVTGLAATDSRGEQTTGTAIRQVNPRHRTTFSIKRDASVTLRGVRLLESFHSGPHPQLQRLRQRQ
jgi:hypothetical protein